MNAAASQRVALEARVASDRAALAGALGDLGDQLRAQVRAQLDLGRRVRDCPAAWLAGAMVIGFLLGVRR